MFEYHSRNRAELFRIAAHAGRVAPGHDDELFLSIDPVIARQAAIEADQMLRALSVAIAGTAADH